MALNSPSPTPTFGSGLPYTGFTRYLQGHHPFAFDRPLAELTVDLVPWPELASIAAGVLAAQGHGAELEFRAAPVAAGGDPEPVGPGLQPRRIRHIKRFGKVEGLVAEFSQTENGIPVDGAGLSMHYDARIEAFRLWHSHLLPTGRTQYRVGSPPDRSVGEIELRRLASRSMRQVQGAASAAPTGLFDSRWVVLPANAVRPEARLALKVRYHLTNQGGLREDYVALLDGETRTILQLRKLVDHALEPVTVRYFAIDPVSHPLGSWAHRPHSPKGALEAAPTATKQISLSKDDAPGGHVRLTGRFVAVEPDPVIGIAPPTQPPGSFDIKDPRTDDFGAVSAYVHCNDIVELFETMGFDLKALLNLAEAPAEAGQIASAPPIRVHHRASISPGCRSGRCVNATVQPVLTGDAGQQVSHFVFRFALGDLRNNPKHSPLGIAADGRFAWHEFSHALLFGTTGKLQLDFAHSGGDALAAIYFDPESRFNSQRTGQDAERGLTYPWITAPNRFHNRPAAAGWRWSGGFYDAERYPDKGDPGGYQSEQILSSTLFWLYRAIGGDAPGDEADGGLGTRRSAALNVIFLFARALLETGRARLDHPAFLACAMIKADRCLPEYHQVPLGGVPRPGGSLSKVIHRAFEQQGLHWPHAHLTGGDLVWPRPADIYIADRREAPGSGGAYELSDQSEHWLAHPEAVWVRNAEDGASGHQQPVSGADNYIYVRVNNRGHAPAGNVRVKVFASSNADARWGSAPEGNDFDLVGEVALGAVRADGEHPAGEVTAGIRWRPASGDVHRLLVVAEADGDPSLLAGGRGLACETGPTDPVDIVPYDNNLAFLELKPIASGGP